MYAHTCWSHDSLDLLHVLKFRRQSPVHAEYFLVNYCRDWKAIKAIGEGLPQLYIVSSFACLLEGGGGGEWVRGDGRGQGGGGKREDTF